MPVHYAIAKERRLVLSTGEGVVTFEEIKAHQDRLLADPELDPQFNQLINMAAVQSLVLSVEEAKLLASVVILAPESRRAVVASEKSVYGMFRLMQAYHESVPDHSYVGIFYHRDEALQWLGARPQVNECITPVYVSLRIDERHARDQSRR